LVDWLNASLGPPEVDVAHCRRNLATMFDVAMADRFLAAYLSLTGRTAADYHPYWDALLLADDSPERSVFQGWTESGLPVTLRQVRARLDAYAASIAGRC
jgi:hypothetical protein